MKLVNGLISLIFSCFVAVNALFALGWLFIGFTQNKLGYFLLGSGWGFISPYLYCWRHPKNRQINAFVATLACGGAILFFLGLAVNSGAL